MLVAIGINFINPEDVEKSDAVVIILPIMIWRNIVGMM